MTLRARMIIELMGRPPEHISKALEMFVEKLGTEKGVTIVEKSIKAPVPVEGSKDLFILFAEVEADFDSISTLLGIVFAYLPSNIEIIEPQSLKLTNSDLSMLVNTLIGRLHAYDSIAKRIIAEKDILIQKLQQNKPKPTNEIPVQEMPVIEQTPKETKKKKAKKTKK